MPSSIDEWEKRVWPVAKAFADSRKLQVWHEARDTDQINFVWTSATQKTCFIMIIPKQAVADHVTICCQCMVQDARGRNTVSGSQFGDLHLDAGKDEYFEVLDRAKSWGDRCTG